MVLEATKKLNAIRNAIAHELEPKGFDDKVRDFIKFITDNTGTPGGDDLKELGPLRCAILSLHAAFYVLVEDTRSASPSNP